MSAYISQLYLITIIAIIPEAVSDGHTSPGTCDMHATRCEFYLDVSLWLPMRRNYGEKVYINDTYGRLYVHGDDSYNQVEPDDVVLADGSRHERALTLFNRTMPGPMLIVYVNQEVIVHVRNQMLSDGVTVHFHGIEMRGTPWMDGASFVTQCPILPGQTFAYRFTPNRKGTYYYHSHTGAQVNMGLVGAFIVKEKKMDEFEEHVLVIQDYNNLQSSDELFANTGLLGFLNAEGEPLPLELRIDGTFSAGIKITSTLINGKGRLFDRQGNQLTNTPLTVFSVKQGKTYKFRVIGGGFALQHKVSIDNHKLTVVAADGNDIDPIVAESFIIHTGERFDFIIEADQAVKSYWIRAETLQKNTNFTGIAILRYKGAEIIDPVSLVQQCSRQNICTVVNCPFETYPNWSCITTDKLHSTTPAPTFNSRSFKEFFVSVGFARAEDNVVLGQMNGISLKLPSVSALTQPKEVTDICDESNCVDGEFCRCNRPLEVNFGDVVQINFFSAGLFNVVHHPIHIHGYSFHVLKVGFRPENSSMVNLQYVNPYVSCQNELCYRNLGWANQSWREGNIPGIDLDRAPRKDTVTLPAGGYVVVRFIADNPGLWYIHCHQEFHVQKGLGLLLNDSFPNTPAPPEGFPECRNFPPPEWLTSDKRESISNGNESMTATYTDGRTFSEEEFWGMFGSLLFVVLLQFIISVWCIRRTKLPVSI